MADDVQVVAIIKTLGEFAEKLIKKLTLDITANLIEDTPVDTGWARANWVPQIGQPYETDVLDHDNRQDKLAAVGGAATTQGAGLAAVASAYTLPQGPVHITNNVPYIVVLNEGSSRQAPSAYVQASIERAVEQNKQATP